MEFDIKQTLNQVQEAINRFIEQAKVYFNSLTQYEMYAWIIMSVGFIMVLIALITW